MTESPIQDKETTTKLPYVDNIINEDKNETRD